MLQRSADTAVQIETVAGVGNSGGIETAARIGTAAEIETTEAQRMLSVRCPRQMRRWVANEPEEEEYDI